ncbi:hypothetical protein [Paraclostridium sordellii]|uniref:hypothetical protein n=1 Tax=Paraclostridium sordellii TaxID=1505 RepID=UPI0003866AAA|nr:hypothetical protein [Paeniclostridium sordellii]EPZ57822.1 hypothetical protein H476_1306 [[Clostridium] sordellii VPI 9048] [Paeniclostridium sordellii VPI 9048]CEK37606.1 hypothetical protein JGS6382_09381 [[Clostridium] sordellii] [Paeniclostridium sordellii]
MSIEEAYSIEYDDIIDAEKAYELFWEGEIKDKTAFCCIYCDSSITCANLDKERSEMRNLPHYRCVEGHKEGCNLISEKINMKVKGKGNGKRETIDETIDELEILSNIDGSRQQDDECKDTSNYSRTSNKEKIVSDYKQGMKRKSKYHSIRPIISKYQKYKKYKLLYDKYINVYKDKKSNNKDINICYREMFIKISDINLSEFSKYKRIYYGNGKIRKINNDYLVIFNQGLKRDDSNIRTTFFINTKQHLSNLKNYEHWIQRLDDLSKISENITIYIYTNSLREKQIPNKNKMESVVNLNLDNIGCFDYRKL